MSKTSFTPSEMVQVRMFFLRDAESGLAVQMVDADYPAHTLTIPKWLCDQKNLTAFVV